MQSASLHSALSISRVKKELTDDMKAAEAAAEGESEVQLQRRPQDTKRVRAEPHEPQTAGRSNRNRNRAVRLAKPQTQNRGLQP